MNRSIGNRWRCCFAWVTFGATLLLICAGGLVTSHGAGLAVPDWPNSYGYNMFFFPVSHWMGGIFYEHTHRLIASVVGFMTGILAVWTFGQRARRFVRWAGCALALAALLACLSGRMETGIVTGVVGVAGILASFVWPGGMPASRVLRVMGVIAFIAVVVQGVLGGLRVTLLKDELGIFHAGLAQLFLVLIGAMAMFESPWWSQCGRQPRLPARAHGLRFLFLGMTVFIFLQLLIGATMRHEHAGLAIPDFPLAYGAIWPDTTPEAITRYNQERLESSAANPITAFQIQLQMVHRLMALLIFLSAAAILIATRRHLPRASWLSRLGFAMFALVLLQAGLGALTIWTGKSADIATAHVAVGALCLVTGAFMTVIAFHRAEPRPAPVPACEEETARYRISGASGLITHMQ